MNHQYDLLLALAAHAKTSTVLTDHLLLALEKIGFRFERSAGIVANSIMTYDITISHYNFNSTVSFSTGSIRPVKALNYRAGSVHHLAYIEAIKIALAHLNSLDNPPAARNVIELFKSRA